VLETVATAAGGRLELNKHHTHMRAVQGHSMRISDDGFERVVAEDDVPRWLIHGTDDAAFLKIRTEGIRPMTRQHVHLAQTVAVVHDYSTVHIYLDKYKLLEEGLELLYVRGHDHGAILCRSTIPPRCFATAWHINKEIDLLWAPSDDWVEASQVETTTRWKQIRLGEWTHEYNVWEYSSDEEKRRFPIKLPPDSSAAMPKRQFLKELSAWRRSLHEFHEWKSGGGGDHERGGDHARGGYHAARTWSRSSWSPPAKSRSSWYEEGGSDWWQSSDTGARSSRWY
jgi:hypothetical protein